MLVAADGGAEDVEADGSGYQVISAPDELTVRAALESAGIAFESAELTMLPKTTVAVEDEATAKKLLRLMDALEENDDVQAVSTSPKDWGSSRPRGRAGAVRGCADTSAAMQIEISDPATWSPCARSSSRRLSQRAAKRRGRRSRRPPVAGAAADRRRAARQGLRPPARVVRRQPGRQGEHPLPEHADEGTSGSAPNLDSVKVLGIDPHGSVRLRHRAGRRRRSPPGGRVRLVADVAPATPLRCASSRSTTRSPTSSPGTSRRRSRSRSPMSAPTPASRSPSGRREAPRSSRARPPRVLRRVPAGDGQAGRLRLRSGGEGSGAAHGQGRARPRGSSTPAPCGRRARRRDLPCARAALLALAGAPR